MVGRNADESPLGRQRLTANMSAIVPHQSLINLTWSGFMLQEAVNRLLRSVMNGEVTASDTRYSEAGRYQTAIGITRCS